ncbi:MAG: hypothetical protein FWE14_06845 [Lachnospiraceae bacterium]|nr:hypothetical protein [Lachnospiraceae bacterium]
MKKRNKNRACLFLLAIFTVLVMSGCKNNSSESIPDFKLENAVKVNEDLSITATLVDCFAEDYYDLDELYQMVNREALVFNEKNGAGGLAVEKVTVEDDKVNVALKFSDREAYANYNEAVFFVGTIEAALNIGLKLDQILVDINDPDKTIDQESLVAMKDSFILITNEHRNVGPLTVETFGRISYVSAGIEVWYGRNSVRIDNIKDELIYVLFK